MEAAIVAMDNQQEVFGQNEIMLTAKDVVEMNRVLN